MSAFPDRGLDAQVARALAESSHLRIDPQRLKDQPLYSPIVGGFGTVRVATLDDQIVAVKELRIPGAHADRARISMRFARELKVWAPLDHPNLLKLHGFSLDREMSIAQFICPFYPHGHVRSYIEAHDPDKETRLKFIEDTALGLQHLHHLNIVHGDLKELNVLVGPEPRALLCDYGIARMINPDGNSSGLTTSGAPMSVRFTSPEILNGSRPDLASDMWAWGCLVLRITADIDPYKGTTDVTCMIKIIQGMPPAKDPPMHMSLNLWGMLLLCWDQSPLARPSISQCIESIRSLLSQSQKLPTLHSSPPLPYTSLSPDIHQHIRNSANETGLTGLDAASPPSSAGPASPDDETPVTVVPGRAENTPAPGGKNQTRRSLSLLDRAELTHAMLRWSDRWKTPPPTFR